MRDHILNNSKIYKYSFNCISGFIIFNKEMYEAHDALTCIGEKNFIDDKNRFKFSNQHFLKNNDELTKLFADLPEALENNFNFHLRFNFKPKKSKPILPSIANQSGNSPEKELYNQAKSGLENRINNFVKKTNTSQSNQQLQKIYTDRLNHELNIINSMDYASYFLIVSDYIKWAKKN